MGVARYPVDTEDTEKIVEDTLTNKIIGAAIEVHKLLGPGLLESIYEEALCHEMGLRGINFQRQVAVDVVYKGCVIHRQRLDILVNSEVIVEIKSLKQFLKLQQRKCFRI